MIITTTNYAIVDKKDVKHEQIKQTETSDYAYAEVATKDSTHVTKLGSPFDPFEDEEAHRAVLGASARPLLLTFCFWYFWYIPRQTKIGLRLAL